MNKNNMPERLNKVKEVLAMRRMSQKELAYKLGKSPNAVTAFCNNRTQPHLITLKEIADILEVRLRDLVV